MPLGRAQRFIKRLIDIVLASTGLVVLLPVLAVVAVLLKRSSPGPVFHREVRLGRWSNPFWTCRFRTRATVAGPPAGAAAGRGRENAAAQPKPLGRRLERWGLDGMPELLNVLAGRMSLIGPQARPWDDACLMWTPRQRRIRRCRPGLMGPSQLRRMQRGRPLSPHEELELDTQYAERASLVLDLRVMTQTAALFASRRIAGGWSPLASRTHRRASASKAAA